MNIIVNEDLKAYIDPLTPEEYDALERSILSEGCRDALVLWGDTLVDGHNRHAICLKHDLPFRTLQSTPFNSLEDVHLWMIDQHLGRRSVSDFQRGVLALRKRAIVAERKSRAQSSASTADGQPHHTELTSGAEPAPWETEGSNPAAAQLRTREDIAKAARLSSSQVLLIEKIQKQAAPELVAAVKSGDISLNAAAAVASLPEDEQRSTALAGKDQLKLAAKRVREAKRQARGDGLATPVTSEKPGDTTTTQGESPALMVALKQQVTLLQAENEQLRQQVAHLQARLSARPEDSR